PTFLPERRGRIAIWGWRKKERKGMASNAAAPFWRAAGMAYITHSNECSNLVRNLLDREKVHFFVSKWVDGKPQKPTLLTDSGGEGSFLLFCDIGRFEFIRCVMPNARQDENSGLAQDCDRAPKLAGTVNWGTATVIGVFAGLLYGGSKEAAASVSKDAEVMLKLGSTPDKREQYRLMRDAMEKRFIRVARGSIVGGIRLGMFTAGFYGVQNLLAEKRGVNDVFNVVGAGSATAATFGLILPGSLRWRARNMLLGSALGAALCFPLGWIHLKLVEKANEGNDVPVERGEAKSGVGAAIERLEGHLNK
ncbi:hypothetical protein Tsubulata_002953, partial [Turnera subulata]